MSLLTVAAAAPLAATTVALSGPWAVGYVWPGRQCPDSILVADVP